MVVSGLRSRVGASRVLLQAIDAGMVTPLVSVAVVIEYEAVARRAEHRAVMGLTDAQIDRFPDEYVALADHIEPFFGIRPSVQDADDEMFAELAINGSADAVVSFNLADYRPLHPAAPALHIPVVRPSDILRRLSWRPSVISRSGFLLH